MKNFSLNVKYLFFISLVLSIVTITLGCFLFTQELQKSEYQIKHRINDILSVTNSSIGLHLWQYDNQFLAGFVKSIGVGRDIAHISIIDNEGLVHEKSDYGYEGKTIGYFSSSPRFHLEDIQITYKNIAIGKLRIVIDKQYYIFSAKQRTLQTLIYLLVTCCIAVLMSYLFLRNKVEQPLSKLASHTLSILKGNHQHDLHLRTDGSIEKIALNIEAMRQELIKLSLNNESSGKYQLINRKLKIEIVERHNAEKLLRKSEEKFKYVLTNSPDVIYNINLKSGTYDYISPAIQKISGYSVEEFITMGVKGIFKKIHKEDISRVTKHFFSHLSGVSDLPEKSVIEYRLKHKNKGIIYINDTRTIVFDKHGKPISVVGSARDISDQKIIEKEKDRLQEKLRQSHKMEAIGTLAGGIAHDFNNILGAILGYADMAKEDVKPGSSVHRDLNEIIKAGDRAKELVRQILAYSRKESTQHVSTSIVVLLKETTKLLRATIPSNIKIQLSIEKDCGNIFADPTQIHQLILNLGTNSLHAIEAKGGTLKINLTREKGTLNKSAVKAKETDLIDIIKLQIEDDGDGIPKKYLDRIFDPYFTTKDVGKGSGMGLTVVAGIVKSHGGTISVKSTKTVGTVFTLKFPELEKERANSMQHASQIPIGQGNILLVDDEIAIVKTTKRRLGKMGYTVTGVTDSREALTLFENSPDSFDLLITDQTMPHLTGDMLSKEILGIRHDIPILICSGYLDRLDDLRRNMTGNMEFLLKPVDKIDLANTISTLLSSSNTR